MLFADCGATETEGIDTKGEIELREIAMGYKKYNWVGNQIADRDMGLLYKRKEKEGIPITEQVAEAVKEYVTRKGIT